jgi:hypothetical protein
VLLCFECMHPPRSGEWWVVKWGEEKGYKANIYRSIALLATGIHVLCQWYGVWVWAFALYISYI